jgi:hypothetical protein
MTGALTVMAAGRQALHRLPDSTEEVSSIAKLYQPGDLAVYLGPAAKEELYMSSRRRPEPMKSS